MKLNLRRFIAGTAALILLMSVFQKVGAHANLLDSIPKANDQLEQSPAVVELFFSEAIEPSFSTIEVLDVNGARVDNQDARVTPSNPTQMRATLRSLPDGVYTVSWRTLSSVDSHITAGVFPFAVGVVESSDLEAAAQAGQKYNIAPVEVISRWLTFLTSMTLTGGMIFLLMVWQPALLITGLKGEIRLPWQKINRFSVLLLLLVSFLWLMIQAGQVTGSNLAAPWSSELRQVLFSTRFGALWLARVALALAALWLLQGKPTQKVIVSIFLLGLLILLTISIGSHAAAEVSPIIPMAGDWIHLIAASVWVGGLIHFVSGLWTLRDEKSTTRTTLTAVLIPRFSVMALISVSVIALTGTYAAIIHIGSVDGLISTAYGRTLLIKLAFFLPMVALGAVNLLNTSPQMKKAAREEDPGTLFSRFRRLLSSEVILGAFVLLSVGLLTSLPPASVSEEKPAAGGTQESDDLEIALEVSPARPGSNTFLVSISSAGSASESVREVSLKFTPTTIDVPPSSVTLENQGNGKYGIEGGYLALADTWQVQVAVRRTDTFDSFANFDLEIGTAGSNRGQDVSQSIPWHRITGLLTVAAAVFLGLALAPVFGDRPIKYASILPVILISTIGIYVFFDEPEVDLIAMANPVPPNVESLAIGEELYGTNCFHCHGNTGAGDGPVGLTLNPPPADLTIHTVPGIHPDGQLFEWITNGLPGSLMPAFGENLSDEERWHLVNYIRTLAQP